MVVASNAPARKQNLSGTFALPRVIFDDPWFTPERIFRLAYIAGKVRYRDNCVVKAGQETWTLDQLHKAWGCSVKVVRNTLAGLEKRGIIRAELGKIKGKLQTIITYLFSTTYARSEVEEGNERATKGQRKGNLKESGESGKKKDSCPPQAADAFKPDPMFLPDEDEPEADQATGAGPSDEALGAGQSEAPECSSAASDDAGPPSSAAPPKLYPEEFDNLWLTCPKREGTKGSKAVAFKSWKKLRAEERLAAQRGAEAWAKRVGDEISAYTPMASTWINQKRWETENEPDPKQPKDQDYHRKLEELYAAF